MNNDEKDKLNVDLQFYRFKQNEINREIKKINDRLTEIRHAEEEQEMDNFPDEESAIKYFLFEDGLVDGERYTRRQAFWRSKGLMNAGYYSFTNQVQLHVIIKEDDDVKERAETIRQIIPFMKPVDNHCVVFGVLSSDFSEVELHIHTYGECWIEHDSTWKHAESLEDAIALIQRYYPYE